MKRAFVLINLGTPDSPEIPDVRRYLREFLADPRVLTMPALVRYLVLYCFILPFRPKKSSAAYKKIWTAAGSPLLAYGKALSAKIERALGVEWDVFLAMRYGTPSIDSVTENLARRHYEKVVVFPLFPQYSSAAFGSAVELFLKKIASFNVVPPVKVIKPYFDHPQFIAALAEVAEHPLKTFRPDHVLLSYHGLPESHCAATDIKGAHCLKTENCCDHIVEANSACYRAQCFATTRALSRKLGLTNFSTAFQSRLGRTPWIKPYTDLAIDELLRKGVKRLAVLEPSFTADCLETLEEVGLRLREDWLAKGGEDLLLVPSLNDSDAWVKAIQEISF